MSSIISRYLRLFICLLLAGLVLASGGDDLAARKKKRSRRAKTTKVKKSRKKKKRRSKSPAYSLPVVVLGSTDPIDPPEPFVTLPHVKEAPEGLDGRTIAVWPSHGKYFSGGWVWQRPRLFGTVEDLLSRSFVDPYVVPMLENAGAYVMLPRERDFSTSVLIIDNNWSNHDGRFSTSTGRHKWEVQADSTGYGHRGGYIVQGENPFLAGTSGMVKTVEPKDSARRTTANWHGTPPESGDRAVYVSYQSYPNSATDAVYTINHLGGSSKVTVNQRMGGGTWVYVGTYPFSDKPGELPLVTLSNVSADQDAVVSADAVRIGGGMGIVARSKGGGTPRTSGYPAFLEGARYYLQGAGFPEEVYSVNKGDNDYVDDYTSRAHWVNWLAGGSVLHPDSTGLKVPVDMALAFHTDAGIKPDSATVGTLGLYSTDDGSPLGNGTSRYANRDLTSSVTSQVVNDIRSLYDPNWTSRGNRDRRYYEVRATKVPAMIIELLSHQNFEDMKRALDPEFRFLVGRAVYKGILKFLAGRYDQPYTVQPLPVEAFAIRASGDGYYNLSWQPVNDPLEPTATPTYYIVYEATPDRYYHPVAVTGMPSWSTRIDDDKIHAYYIVAGNNGGVSFPSETLALYDNRHQMPSVEIVNGFTRVSSPEWFDGEEYAGFDFTGNYGVPDGRDIHYIGPQFDNDPTSRLGGSRMGFGESYDSESSKTRTGNTHDYPIIHGEALRKAGRGFVSSSLKAFELGKADYKAVDLILGLQKTTRKAGSSARYFQTFPRKLRDRLKAYKRNGGALLVSGSYLSSEIWEADSLTRDSIGRFAADVLGYKPYILTDTIPTVPGATSSMELTGANTGKGEPKMRPSSLASFKNGDWVGAGTPQAITPANSNGKVIARYADSQFPAAIAVEGVKSSSSPNGRKGRVVVAGFPIESMEDGDARENFIITSLDYLIGPEPPAVKQGSSASSDDNGKASGKDKKKKKKDKKDKKKKSSSKDKKVSSTKGKKTSSKIDGSKIKDGKAAVPAPAPKPKDSKPRPVPRRRKNNTAL